MARVLLVDDEEYIRQIYRKKLADEGYQVFTSAVGPNLWSRIDRVEPEVVILDLKLVDYDGLELLLEIRNRHDDLPVILCSADNTFKEDLRAIAANYYVMKSFDLSELKRAIQRALGENNSGRLTA